MTTQTSTPGGLVRRSVSYTGNGATTNYAIPFAVTHRPSIVVKVAGVIVTNYTFAADNSSITFAAAPANGASILITSAVSVYASAAVMPNPLNTKATLGMADQITRTKTTVTQGGSKTVTHGNIDDASVAGTLIGKSGLVRTTR